MSRVIALHEGIFADIFIDLSKLRCYQSEKQRLELDNKLERRTMSENTKDTHEKSQKTEVAEDSVTKEDLASSRDAYRDSTSASGSTQASSDAAKGCASLPGLEIGGLHKGAGAALKDALGAGGKESIEALKDAGKATSGGALKGLGEAVQRAGGVPREGGSLKDFADAIKNAGGIPHQGGSLKDLADAIKNTGGIPREGGSLKDGADTLKQGAGAIKDAADVSKDKASAGDQSQESKQPWEISKDIVDAVKNGKPLDQVQKEISAYIQKMMASGLSEFEMRNWVGKLSNELSARNTGLTDAQGKPMDLAVRLGGDGKDRFGVYIIANEMTKDEKVLSQFDVKRDAAAANTQDKTAENKEPYQIAKDLAESLKNGGSLEQFQKDIAGYIQKMMAAGMSEFDMRTWVGNIGNAMRDALRGAKDSNGKLLDYAIMMGGDGKDGFTVHLIRDVFTKGEQELNRFYVPCK